MWPTTRETELSRTIPGKMRLVASVAIIGACRFVHAGAPADSGPLAESPQEGTVAGILAPADTTSPRDTLRSFCDSVDRLHVIFRETGSIRQGESQVLSKRAVACLDLSDIAPSLSMSKGREAAVCLKEVFDRIDLPAADEIPDDNAVAKNPPKRWRVPGTEITLVRIADGPREGEYLFDKETVARAVEFFDRVRNLPYKPTAGSPGLHQWFATRGGWMIPDAFVQRLPSWAHAVCLGETVWQWTVAAILVAATVVLLGVARGISRRAVSDIDPDHPVRHAAAFVFPLAAIGGSLLLDYALTWQVRFTGETLYAAKIVLKVLMFAGVIFGVVAMIRGFAEVVIRAKRLRPEGIDGQLVRLACQVATFVAVAWLLIVGANSMGISVTPLIAGLSVSGLAVALAAQYTVENLIAGVVLFIDKPVRIGDTCQFGELKGTVEQIGLRSTRIRGVDRTLISIPNAEFAKLRLVNYTRRDRSLLQHRIGLTHGASASQVRDVVDRIHHAMLSHPRIANEQIEVQFVGYGDSSLDIEIVGYVLTSDGAVFLDVQQEILLAIMGIVAEAGCEFAFPTRTLHVVGRAAAAEHPVFAKKAA